MKFNLLWRIVLVVVVIVVASMYLIPSFLPAESRDVPVAADAAPAPRAEAKKPEGWRALLPDKRISLGLDLSGGINLTLEVQVDKALEGMLGQTGPRLAKAAGDKGLLVARPKLLPDGKLEIMLIKPSDQAAFEALLATEFSTLRYDVPQEVGGRLRYLVELTPAARQEYAERTLDKALESIRDRIDQFGVAEPDIRKQSSGNRLIIQLPGMQDTSRALDIISKTAHLEFRLVRDDVNPYGVMPPGVEVLPTQRGSTKILAVEKTPALTGDHISDARAIPRQRGERDDMPTGRNQKGDDFYVALSLDREGSKIFARVTGENKDRRLAIVLDGVIHSAPVINQRIDGGEASITGNFNGKEAADLALVLRSGSLPAPVKVLEERTVGPSLGQEAITKGVQAVLFGGAAVMLFMLVYYGLSGIIADFMLILDVVLILAGMAAFGATLTLPGIAGIVLTIGMAVDANVLVFERIREELARGLTPALAVETGFSRAMMAITDSNLTTVIAGIILYQFGSGPIRGFAVTLLMGIIASMFTAIFVSRIVFDLWMSKPGRKLSI